MAMFFVPNGPMPTTAIQAALSTGTGIKTHVQIKPFKSLKIKAWHVSFDGSAAATPIRCELLETAAVAATVTAHVDAGCPKYNDPSEAAASAAGLTLATSGTGYNASVEGTITAVRMFDSRNVPPTGGIDYYFPLGQEPVITAANIGRIRIHAPASVNAIAWMLVEL